MGTQIQSPSDASRGVERLSASSQPDSTRQTSGGLTVGHKDQCAIVTRQFVGSDPVVSPLAPESQKG